MKFVLSYTERVGGSVQERVAGGEAAQKLLANWAPRDSATIHQWVQRCDGTGGFAVVETDNPADLFSDLAVWAPWLAFEVVPVLDIADATPIAQDALQKARSVL
jgi:Protein of unknown function (DUF3303)